MSWFDEQLKYRKEKDDAAFADAIGSVAGAVMGKRLADALDEKEIAQSAIGEILKFYHHKIQEDELPPQIKTVDEQLEYRMRPFGIMRRTVKLEDGWYKDAVGAMLGTLKEDGTAVALLPGKLSGYTYLNLKTGKRVRINRKTAEFLDGEALCFYQPLPLRALTIRDLLVFMAEQFSVSDGVLYVGTAALTSVIGLLSPLFTRWLFGDVLASGSTTVLAALASFMVCYSLCSLLISAYRGLVNTRIGTKQNIAVQAAVMSRLLMLPASFFKGYAAGELRQRASCVEGLCSTLMNSFGTTVLTSLFSLIYLGQVFVFAPALVVPSLVITVLTLLISTVTTLVQTQVSRGQMMSSSKVSGMAYSTITGIQKIKLAGAEKRMFSRWAKAYAGVLSLSYNPPLFLRLSGTLNLTVSLIGTLILYALAVRSGVNTADYYAFNSAYGMVSGAFSAAASIAVTIAGIRPTLEMVKPILEAEPEVSEGKQIITELRGGIELSHVSFRYNADMPNVIDDLSVKIRSGEYVALVGSTGCGKSTLLRLLLGFEKPQKGAVYYDGKDISRVDLKSLRRKIGTVMQDGKLFSGDIYSNIVISAPHLTLKEAWEAAEIASVADDIRAMPMGMHTIISEGQGGISGGQKQRLMIARAVAPRPKILMFDEATSALDNVTQKNVTDAIDRLKCTRVVIAHRLSTIRHADRILYLEKGKITEEGTYEQLIALNGSFAALVARQRLDIDVE